MPVSGDEAAGLLRSYDPKRLNIADYGYLLDRHPLDVWSAGQMVREPGLSWDELLKRSATARELASRWLFQTRNRHAQDLRRGHRTPNRLAVSIPSIETNRREQLRARQHPREFALGATLRPR